MVRFVVTLLVPALLGAAPPSKSRSPEALVLRQVEAFNAHDAEAFSAFYAEDSELSGFPVTSTPLLRGRTPLRTRMAETFRENPDLHARIKEQMVHGEMVVHLTRITGLKGRPAGESWLVLYQVKAGLIQKAWLLQPDPKP